MLRHDRPTKSPSKKFQTHTPSHPRQTSLLLSNTYHPPLIIYVPTPRHRYQPPLPFPPSSHVVMVLSRRDGPGMRACTGVLGVRSQPERALKPSVKGVSRGCLSWYFLPSHPFFPPTTVVASLSIHSLASFRRRPKLSTARVTTFMAALVEGQS